MEKITPTKKVVKITDVFLASAITSVTGQEPGTEVDHSLTVFIYEPSDKLTNVIAAYSTNQPFFIQDFLSSYKRLRALMYAARG